MTIFAKESDFEEAVITQLRRYGWEEVLSYVDEAALIDNWAQILFDNNCDPDHLNYCPLTATEKQQLLTKIREARYPCALNEFINGGSVLLKRDNPDDVAHLGHEVALKIYSRTEIAAGQSRYQIVRQPRFDAAGDLLSQRRGDLLLLINGMPVIHIELKRSGIPVSQACNQIERYSRENLFQGNLGTSYRTNLPVMGMVLERLGPTLILTIASTVLSVLIAVPLGIVSAYKPYSPWDYISSGLSFIGASTPTFFTGLVFIYDS